MGVRDIIYIDVVPKVGPYRTNPVYKCLKDAPNPYIVAQIRYRWTS